MAKKPTKADAATAPAPTQAAQSIGGIPLRARGRTFTGTVVSDRMTKTVTVEWPRRKFIAKYQRYEKRRTRVKAHDEMGAKVGNMVEIMETRPISKTKHFIVTKILKA